MYKFKPIYDEKLRITIMDKIPLFGVTTKACIIRRLMCQSSIFKDLPFSEAYKMFCYLENNNLIKIKDGFITIYHNAN